MTCAFIDLEVEDNNTEEIDTTTSQGEIQFDVADKYNNDDSFPDSCNYNGSVYKNIEDLPSTNPCQLCLCFKGNVIYHEGECITPTVYENCGPIPVTDGACCTSSWDSGDFFILQIMID